ncbi:hypothetical protein BO71DRAFT_402310 [Aspergillus ellipticus CBS 707.79]|uniref:Uncharacterized protein n=1 Tax=Aspergillus ellipticus CBS 707.79 TaxID=1448320 RepID=A0A319CZY4_9EURO|nr:hypothetical protein BO71DRAFT_402310 [Aspergillus ellipticus CBS 707.79]
MWVALRPALLAIGMEGGNSDGGGQLGWLRQIQPPGSAGVLFLWRQPSPRATWQLHGKPTWQAAVSSEWAP